MTYELHKLGWHGFQRLCLTVAREVLGQTVESFLDSNDAGMDGAFAGTWNPAGLEELSGQFVIQCKFTGKSDYSLKPTDVSDELPKAKRLVEQGRCDCYILLTNAGLSGDQSNRIKDEFKAVGVKHVVTFGGSWICQQIQDSKRLRMLVPRVYGLGDLTQILDERAYSQALALLASMRDDLSKVVVTGAYQRAAEAIDEHGFVLLIGEPAAGKTTIASLLAMGALDQWHASTLKLVDPSEVKEHWNPDEPSQFFWVDDAFGVNQYESDLVHGWNHIFSEVSTMIRRGAKIVMTSRDYVYKRARNDLKESAFPLIRGSQVVIDVRDLSADERKQILYNHLKLGRQPREFRSAIKPYLEDIAAHPRFIPETARRLSDPLFTKGLQLDRYTLAEFVDRQEQFLREVITVLDCHSKAALALIYMCNDGLQSPVVLGQSESMAIERLGSNLGGCITALNALNGSLVLHTNTSGISVWRFKHPTIGDAFAGILVQNPELLGVYVQGSPMEKLISQVTCGEAGIERAVVIPKTLFPLMMTKLQQFSSTVEYKTSWLSKWGARSRVQTFLAYRCSKEFLMLYIENNPDILDRVSKPGLMLSAVSEVDLAIRLQELGLLPEDRRKVFIAAITSYAVNGEDFYVFESRRLRKIFTRSEIKHLRASVRLKTLPKLAEVRRDRQGDYYHDRDGSAEDYIQPLLDSFNAVKKEFRGDSTAVSAIEREIGYAHQWAADHVQDEPDDAPKRELGEIQTSEDVESTRSIFEDVDT